MSEVSPESALELRQAILGHATWNESMPELAGFDREGFVAIDGGRVERGRLPAVVLARLGIIAADADDGSKYELDLGRRVNRRFKTLSAMYAAWHPDRQWDPAYVYDDYGIDSAYVRIRRSNVNSEGVNALLAAYYTVSAEEPYEPGQPPLCSVRVDIEDHMPMRQLALDMGEKGGSLVDLARAMGIDPITGKRDPDKPEVTSDTDLHINLANELGEPLSEEQIAALREDETVAAEMQLAETKLHPLTTPEILGLAMLARSAETSIQI